MCFLRNCFFVFLLMFLSGCERHYDLDVRKDLSATLVFFNKDFTLFQFKWRKKGESEQEQQKKRSVAMNAFYQKAPSQILNEEFSWISRSFQNSRLEILNPRETECDIRISAEIKCVEDLWDPQKCIVIKTENGLLVQLGEEKDRENNESDKTDSSKKDEELITFTVHYDGPILAQNAQKVSNNGKTLFWSLGQLKEDGMWVEILVSPEVMARLEEKNKFTSPNLDPGVKRKDLKSI